MKYLISTVVLSLLLASCSSGGHIKKSSDYLIGTWRLFEIQNSYTGEVIRNTTVDQGDVKITFNGDQPNTLDGRTPRNRIWGNYVTKYDSEMQFDIKGSTTVGENYWGTQFELSGVEETTQFSICNKNILVLRGTISTLIFVRL